MNRPQVFRFCWTFYLEFSVYNHFAFLLPDFNPLLSTSNYIFFCIRTNYSYFYKDFTFFVNLL